MATEHDQDLPGMEDRAIGALEKLATEYADLVAEGKALKERKAALESKTVATMKRLGRLHYRRNGMVIEIVPSADKVKITIPKPSADVEGDEHLRRGVAREH